LTRELSGQLDPSAKESEFILSRGRTELKINRQGVPGVANSADRHKATNNEAHLGKGSQIREPDCDRKGQTSSTDGKVGIWAQTRGRHDPKNCS